MIRLLVTACAASLLASCATAQVNAPGAAKSCFHRNEAVETDIGYCQAIRSGNTLHISGSVGQGDMPVAIHKAYDTIRQTLAANGLDFRDIVKENVFATDLDAFIRNKEIRKEYYGSDFPAATWVQVQRLYLPAFVVEVEVTAVFRK
jgi:enamine deaminase RidA (YjgF/YER057c/UK114 family)